MSTMTLILTWEDPVWRLHEKESKAEAEGETIEECFAALYEALAGDTSECLAVEVLNPSPVAPSAGLYRIVMVETGGQIRVTSPDVLGLALYGPTEQIMLDLPTKVADLLGEQNENFTRVT